MSQNIILKRELITDTWLIQGEIARAVSRPELNCVLQYLKDYPNSTAGQCSGHLFGDEIGRKVVADRLLNIASSYRLVEAERGTYRLTNTGGVALQKEQVLVPEDGCWKVCVCNDPLLPHKLISIEPHKEPSASSTGLNKNRDKLAEREKNLKRVSKSVLSIVKLQAEPITGGNEVRIDKIEYKGEQLEPQGTKLNIEWDITGGVFLIKKGKELVDRQKVNPIERKIVLNVFLQCEGLFDHWDEQSETLMVNFDEATNAERVSMERAVKISTPEIHSMGVFDPLILPSITINTRSTRDAKEWAMWRLKNSTNMYASSEKYEIWKEKALAPFANFDCTLPSRDILASDLWHESNQHTQETWHVIAANDWNL
jgi:hypothetical protein